MQRLFEIIEASNTALTPDRIYDALTRDICDTMDADLVSVWRFDASMTKLTQLYSFDREHGASNAPLDLNRRDYPRYFNDILDHIYLIANSLDDHPVFNSLTEGISRRERLPSVLDHLIYQDRQPVGIICCEARTPGKWSMQDVNRVRALTVAMSFEFKGLLFPGTAAPSAVETG